jgi:hypothetical protein
MSCAGAAIANANWTGWSRLVWVESVIARSYAAIRRRDRRPRFSTATPTRRSGAAASLLVPGSLPVGLGPERRYRGDIAAWTSHALNPRAGQREGGRGSLLHEPVENDGGADRDDDGGDAGGKKRAHSSLHSFGLIRQTIAGWQDCLALAGRPDRPLKRGFRTPRFRSR